jgi:hypothetical protein
VPVGVVAGDGEVGRVVGDVVADGEKPAVRLRGDRDRLVVPLEAEDVGEGESVRAERLVHVAVLEVPDDHEVLVRTAEVRVPGDDVARALTEHAGGAVRVGGDGRRHDAVRAEHRIGDAVRQVAGDDELAAAGGQRVAHDHDLAVRLEEKSERAVARAREIGRHLAARAEVGSGMPVGKKRASAMTSGTFGPSGALCASPATTIF